MPGPSPVLGGATCNANQVTDTDKMEDRRQLMLIQQVSLTKKGEKLQELFGNKDISHSSDSCFREATVEEFSQGVNKINIRTVYVSW